MILVRHGQSEFNVVYSVTRVDPGIPDPKLTDQGRHQAREVAAALAQHGLTRIVASPYTRAVETAEIIAAALRLDLSIEPLVREHCRFHCDIGSPASHLAQRWPEVDFSHLPERWWPDLDETEEQLAARGQDFRRAMAAHDAWRSTAVVTHWGFIRALTGQRVPNAHLLRFDPHSGEARDLAPPAVP
jgi:glucosyl-3-phosphoglycerate phosphatase